MLGPGYMRRWDLRDMAMDSVTSASCGHVDSREGSS